MIIASVPSTYLKAPQMTGQISSKKVDASKRSCLLSENALKSEFL